MNFTKPLRRALILDTETTGLTETDKAVEIAAILFDLTYASPIASFAALITHHENPAESTNRIPAGLLGTLSGKIDPWRGVADLYREADVVLAHNADFDRRYVPAAFREALPWVCTCNDVEWPGVERPGQNLVSLVLSYGLGVASAHRAMTDCDMISRLLTRVRELGYELEPLLRRGLRPKAVFAVVNERFDRARNALAKANGFRWNDERKLWLRKMPIEDAEKLPFKVVEVES